MYVSASDLIPMPDATCRLRASNRRLARTQCQVNKGRMGLFETTPSVSSLAAISPELGVNGKRLLEQSEVGRASVVGAGTPPGNVQGSASPSTVARQAPKVQPLNGPRVMNACASETLSGLPFENSAPPAAPPPPVPLMPKPGPVITSAGLRDLPAGPMEQLPQKYMALPGYRAAGLSGIAPPWGDSAGFDDAAVNVADGGFMGWIKQHPWLSLGIAGGLVLLATDERRRGRRGY